MGIFRHDRPRKRYVSNTTPEQLDLFEQLDRTVVLCVEGGSPLIDGALHMCITQAGYEKAAAALELSGEGSGPYQAVLGMGLDTVLQQKGYEALVVYGLAGDRIDFILTREDLEPMKDVVDSFCILYAAARGAMPQERAQALMRKKTIWFLGELPKAGKKGEQFGFATIEREGGYEAVRCFLTPESAGRYNDRRLPVTPARVGDLETFVSGLFALIIEPHRNYWMELGAENAKRRG
ncbi:hypothetical protein D7V91_06235 [bacterium 1xD42-67]|nr:hypothetical protein D7V91_06235 [bacterium 1xD42-67]